MYVFSTYLTFFFKFILFISR